jgi:hypothetical protein
VTRDENGKFIKGVSGNPAGRPKKEREERYRDILVNSVTFADWEAIIGKAVKQAKGGDSVARKWLSDYLIGPPIQRQELTGKDGSAIEVIHVRPGDNDD